MDYDINDDKLEVEIGKNLFWFDGPIGRFRYFMINLVIFIIEFVALILFKEIFILLFKALWPILILGILLIVWITFVATAKRLYDITTSLKNGIIISVVLMLVSLLLSKLSFLIFLVLVFIPGKMIKNNY